MTPKDVHDEPELSRYIPDLYSASQEAVGRINTALTLIEEHVNTRCSKAEPDDPKDQTFGYDVSIISEILERVRDSLLEAADKDQAERGAR